MQTGMVIRAVLLFDSLLQYTSLRGVDSRALGTGHWALGRAQDRSGPYGESSLKKLVLHLPPQPLIPSTCLPPSHPREETGITYPERMLPVTLALLDLNFHSSIL